MRSNVVNQLAIVTLLITGISSCRTSSDNAFLLEADEAYPDDQSAVIIDAKDEASLAQHCTETGNTEEYFLRPVDTDDAISFQIAACLDQKFRLRAIDIKSNRGSTTTQAKTSSVVVSIPPEYMIGIFDRISYEDSAGKMIEINVDDETNYLVPGYPPVLFYEVTIGDESPVLMYQSNIDDQCPREWFASEEADQRFQTASGDLLMDAYICQSMSNDGTLLNLPLWVRFESIPESLENELKQTYHFLELKPHSLRRNFRHEFALDEQIHFVDEAQGGDPEQGCVELYPSRIRQYRLESRLNPCDMSQEDSEICLTEPEAMNWSYTLARSCHSAPPTATCQSGESEGEYYCHTDQWRCRFRQTSSSTHLPLSPAGQGEICELGGDSLYIPHCKSGLTCRQTEDSDIARCN